MTLAFINQLVEKDKELFLWINSHHISWLTPIMEVITSNITWAIMCALVLAFMFYKKKRNGLWPALFLIFSLGLNACVNYIIKYIVARPRPINNEAFDDVIHAIEKLDQSFSFYSSHSSSSFCLLFFTIFFWKNKYYTIFMSFWAVIVAYSRLYVGMHYPLDIFVGIIMGTIFGILGYRIYNNMQENRLLIKI